MNKFLKYTLISFLLLFCFIICIIIYEILKPVELDLQPAFDEFFEKTFSFDKSDSDTLK